MATSVVRARLAATVSLVALCLATPTLADQAQEQAATIDDIIVTAQKREESIQSVPIAVSAFSSEALDAMKIEGGSELLRAVPNVTFSKNNFSMFNFSIRGVGTKSISSASDPAVAISFNNSPMIRNRLFESEYLDVNRVEVLRGPQGTLYGRNATGGVVNMLPNMPDPEFDAMLKVEAGNFGSMRGQGMVNVPLTDNLWFRAAASLTKREGFDYNTFNNTKVNGRDLHSVRLGLAWEPTDSFRSSLIWEMFSEDDNRSRTGKQLCTPDPGPSKVGDYVVTNELYRARLSQGCQAKTLFDDAAYGTPNALALSQLYAATFVVGYSARTGTPGRQTVYSMKDRYVNPYQGVVQSTNLREISTDRDPKFSAKNDIIQFNMEFDVSDNLTLYSQTFYTRDNYNSIQDYARYASNDIFADTNRLFNNRNVQFDGVISPGGIYVDPQLGPSSRMVSVDLSRSNNSQWSQEFRLQSSGNDRFNFSIGANYLNFKTEDDYFVFNNLFSFISEYFYNIRPGATIDARVSQDCVIGYNYECVYVDPTSLSDLAGDGHNYFRSKNKVNTESWALFGEAYYDISENKRITVGLRYTDDKKTTTPYPSQLLLGAYPDGSYGGSVSGGYVHRGFPALPDVVQSWDAVTGRVVFDWKPSERTMMYASYSRGYKGGGTNPPRADINPEVVQYQALAEVFDPEYVNSFEVGIKSSLFDRRLKLNGTAFYYNYSDYQVSQIVDRISLNENFDAEIYGIELETIFQATDRLRFDLNLGLLKSKIGDGEESIDIMNRTQSNPDWMVVRPWLQVPSNCIAPTNLVEKVLSSPFMNPEYLTALCSGSARIGTFTPDFPMGLPLYSMFGFTYNPLVDAPNGGRGFMADLSGNEMPNAPNITLNFGAQYRWSIGTGSLTLRGDYYYQGESYFRVYNTEYDRLEAWGNLNISATYEVPSNGLRIQAYVKNILDDAPIVDVFTNSDDSMLTSNVFTLDPRLWGISVTKSF